MRSLAGLLPRPSGEAVLTHIAADLAPLVRLLGVFALALALGVGSAWYLVDRGTALTNDKIGPWVGWRDAARPDADPYTKAHLARTGRLPISSASAAYFLARVDQEGRALRSDCEYLVEGQPLSATWWSIAVYDTDGNLMPNVSGRHAFNSRDVVRRADGSFQLVLAPNARPGNWLPTPGAARPMALALRAYASRSYTGTLDDVPSRLPAILKVACP